VSTEYFKRKLAAILSADVSGYSRLMADDEEAGNWRVFLRHQETKPDLGIMDGLPGLEKVLLEEFSNARGQRCQIHVSSNGLPRLSEN